MTAIRIADTHLTNVTLIAKNERIEGASIFPFFNKSGQVKQLMIVLPDEKTVFLIPAKKGLTTVSFFGAIKLSIDSAELRSHSNFSLDQVRDLYHYDTNWVLSHERFSDYWAKKIIIQSNCVNYLKGNVRKLVFSSDLSQLKGFEMKFGPLNTFRTIAPEVLLEQLPPTQPEKSDLCIEPASSGWQLSPLWNEWAGSGLFSTQERRLIRP